MPTALLGVFMNASSLMLIQDKKFELMLTRHAKSYSSSGSVVQLKIGVFTLS